MWVKQKAVSESCGLKAIRHGASEIYQYSEQAVIVKQPHNSQT